MKLADAAIVATSIIIAMSSVIFANQPFTLSGRLRRWYQIRWLSPDAGELGVLVEPPFEDVEALIFKMSRTMVPAARVPYGAVVLVIDVDGSSASVIWEDQIAVLPRRWLRRPKI